MFLRFTWIEIRGKKPFSLNILMKKAFEYKLNDILERGILFLEGIGYQGRTIEEFPDFIRWVKIVPIKISQMYGFLLSDATQIGRASCRERV